MTRKVEADTTHEKIETSLKCLVNRTNRDERRRRRRRARLTGLSQQRQTANARERGRTRSFHDALVDLRCHIPIPVPAPNNRKLSKIEILRLAVDYIRYLTGLLEETSNKSDQNGERALKI
uniref:Pancreas transcription factor 1 subunit alpha-like n=1 Tax=Saccoglossus kowalevskii TaxID=10224 RepID=A0ABM0H1B9_SACKO|nr:PREDICTED: pancreas transcription factor 1 subunit alpha-like [Saccoglossus kowalevskii]